MSEQGTTKAPRIYISHSHEDHELAEELARKLRAQGADSWLDKWEIRTGDSIVQKIFEEGLRDCELFLILLSSNSVRSPWVRHELDTAIVQRMAGTTRVVPVVIESCAIPVSLRPLLRLNLPQLGMDETVQRLLDAAFDRDTRPEIGPPPAGLDTKMHGLSNHAARLAILIAQSMDQPDGSPLALAGSEIASALSLTPPQVNDTVEELEALGLVRLEQWLGTAPYRFGYVEPTAALPLHIRDSGVLEYDPEDDIRTVAATVAEHRHIRGVTLQEVTGLSPSRLNRAVRYLDDYGIVDVRRFLGTAPFDFGEVSATSATRRFLVNNAP